MSKKQDPMSLVQKAAKNFTGLNPQYPEFNIGDTIRVHVKVKEGEKTRVQVYEGIVIRKRRGGASSSFTVRKISYGIGVERIFPFFSPVIDKIVVISQGEIRRAKLYYLRALSGRASRIKSEQVFESQTTSTTSSSPSSSDAPELTAKAAQA